MDSIYIEVRAIVEIIILYCNIIFKLWQIQIKVHKLRKDAIAAVGWLHRRSEESSPTEEKCY